MSRPDGLSLVGVFMLIRITLVNIPGGKGGGGTRGGGGLYTSLAGCLSGTLPVKFDRATWPFRKFDR